MKKEITADLSWSEMAQWLMHEMPVVLFMSFVVYFLWKKLLEEQKYSRDITTKAIETMASLNHLLNEHFKENKVRNKKKQNE